MISPSARSSKGVSWASFWSLSSIQSMNSLNEKGVQFLLIALGIWLNKDFQHTLSILIVLPFVLFSPLAGWFSDRYSRTRVLQAMVLLQIIVLVGMSAGLFMHQMTVAIGFFTLFCVQAVFFSPAKKGLVKDIVGTENIGFASGILEITSMLALLAAQIAALYIVYHLLSIWGPMAGYEAAAWPCLCCLAGAVFVFILSFKIPVYQAEGHRPFRWSLFWEHFTQLKMLWQNRVLRHCQVGISFFWFFGGFMMLVALEMAKVHNAIDPATAATGLDQGLDFMRVLSQQKDTAMLLAWMSGGSILGGVTASLLCAKTIRLWISFLGGILVAVTACSLYWCTFGSPFFFASLAICGFAASGFLVPLNALLQDRADNDRRGDVIAVSNLIDCFFGILCVLMQQYMTQVGISTGAQCACLGVLSLLVVIYLIVYRKEI